MKALKKDAYQRITERILSLMAGGKVPWDRPWDLAAQGPMNLTSKKAYRGANVWTLGLTQMDRGYSSRYWCTYNQAKKLGGSVRKGEKGSPIMFWRFVETEKNGAKKTIPFARHATVFNTDQCDGLEGKVPAPVLTPRDVEPIAACEALVGGFSDCPPVSHGGNRACYWPTRDEINMPVRESFKTPAGYYKTLFHEMGHSTGHASRVGRKGVAEGAAGFGSHEYSREELVAELTSAFLCGETGITADTERNAAAYLQNWMKVLNDDPKMFVYASGAAQKSADWILKRQKEEVTS